MLSAVSVFATPPFRLMIDIVFTVQTSLLNLPRSGGRLFPFLLPRRRFQPHQWAAPVQFIQEYGFPVCALYWHTMSVIVRTRRSGNLNASSGGCTFPPRHDLVAYLIGARGGNFYGRHVVAYFLFGPAQRYTNRRLIKFTNSGGSWPLSSSKIIFTPLLCSGSSRRLCRWAATM